MVKGNPSQDLGEEVSSVLKSTSWVGMYYQDVVNHIAMVLPGHGPDEVRAIMCDLQSKGLIRRHERTRRFVWCGPKDGLWKRLTSEVAGVKDLRRTLKE